METVILKYIQIIFTLALSQLSPNVYTDRHTHNTHTVHGRLVSGNFFFLTLSLRLLFFMHRFSELVFSYFEVTLRILKNTLLLLYGYFLVLFPEYSVGIRS